MSLYKTSKIEHMLHTNTKFIVKKVVYFKYNLILIMLSFIFLISCVTCHSYTSQFVLHGNQKATSSCQWSDQRWQKLSRR